MYQIDQLVIIKDNGERYPYHHTLAGELGYPNAVIDFYDHTVNDKDTNIPNGTVCYVLAKGMKKEHPCKICYIVCSPKLDRTILIGGKGLRHILDDEINL